MGCEAPRHNYGEVCPRIYHINLRDPRHNANLTVSPEKHLRKTHHIYIILMQDVGRHLPCECVLRMRTQRIDVAAVPPDPGPLMWIGVQLPGRVRVLVTDHRSQVFGSCVVLLA